MAFLCGRQNNDDDAYDEQPTEPTPAQPHLRPSFDPRDYAETWPDLSAVAVEELIQAAIQRNRERPCPLCIYVRVVRDGEMVPIGPQLPRLCERHMHALSKVGAADWVLAHDIVRTVFDWYHAPPDEYSD